MKQASNAQDIPIWVDQTMATYGRWDVVSFLLTMGRLSQSDYEAWRLGEVGSLEEQIAGSPQRIIALLKLALVHVQQRSLVFSVKTWTGWGEHVGQTLVLFADADLADTFSCVYAPAADRPQLDLFMDAQHVVCFNRLRTALLQRSPALPAMFEDAFGLYASDPVLARLEMLYVFSHQGHGGDVASRFIVLKQDIVPIAVEELSMLSPLASDFLAPLWRNLAQEMGKLPFLPENPDFHASYAWLQAKAYDETLKSIENVACWQQHHRLHWRMMMVYSQQHRVLDMRATWLQLCLHCPQHVSAYVADDSGKSCLQSCGLLHWWYNFSKLEHRPTAADFPAWVLIQQPEYVVSLPHIEVPDDEVGQRLLWVTALLDKKQAANPLVLRKKLQASSSWLFAMLMQKRPGMF